MNSIGLFIHPLYQISEEMRCHQEHTAVKYASAFVLSILSLGLLLAFLRGRSDAGDAEGSFQQVLASLVFLFPSSRKRFTQTSTKVVDLESHISSSQAPNAIRLKVLPSLGVLIINKLHTLLIISRFSSGRSNFSFSVHT